MFATFFSNPVTVCFVVATWIVFAYFAAWARRRDRQDIMEVIISFPFLDNLLRHDNSFDLLGSVILS